MEVVLRTATPADAALIADVSRQTFYDTFAAQNTPEDMQQFLDEQFTRAALMAEVGAPDNIFMLAYVANAIAGYVRLRLHNAPPPLLPADVVEIARLYATKAAIGKGVGKALMQASIDVAKQYGKKTVWLGVWEKNERAIAFYKQWGFQKFGEHPFLLGSDLQLDWLMKKEL